MATLDENRAAINDALAELVADEEGVYMVTAWVASVECCDAEGTFWLHTLGSKDNPVWKRDGMLRHAMNQQTKIDQIASRLEEE